MSDQDIIQQHYRKIAEQFGDSPQSTMTDDITRQREMSMIRAFIEVLEKRHNLQPMRVMDLGCGNGVMLADLALEHSHDYVGFDYSPDLLEIAEGRNLPNCTWQQGDARELPFADADFDAVYSERCLINILEWDGQQQALAEVVRVLRPGGFYLMIESWTDGLTNNNKAREEVGLDAISAPYHNRYFEKEETFAFLTEHFEVVHPAVFDPTGDETRFASNFLSSHYFISRVLHALVSRGDAVKNTEFVKFFSFLQPSGNYAAPQAFILQRREG